MRIFLPVAGAFILLGASAVALPAQTVDGCASQVPADASNPEFANEAWFAGDLILTQVPTQPADEPVTTGRLHLAPSDTTLSRPDLRPWPALTGWFEPESASPEWRAIVASRDPLHPGATLANNAMYIGQHYALDGSGGRFWITAVSEHGFWGWWRNDPGIAVHIDTVARRAIPDPAGYFCAVRVR